MTDRQDQIDDDAQQGSGGDGRELAAEEGDHAAFKAVVAAEADHEDDRDDGQVAGVKQVDLAVDHDRDALGRDDAEEVDADAADDRAGDRVDQI